MAKKQLGNIKITLLIAVAAFMLAAIASVFDLAQMIELKTLDARYLLRGTVDVSQSNIIVAGIDDRSYEELPERMPFPREYYARLIRNLKRAGAKAIIFDIQFDKPAPGDSVLASAIAEAGNVILCGKVLKEKDPHIKEALTHLYPPTTLLLETGVDWGLVNEPNDLDGFTRRYILFQPANNKIYLTIGLKTIKHIKGYSDTVSVQNVARYFYYGQIKIPRVDPNTMLVNFCGPAKTFPTFSFSDILDDAEFNLRKNDTDYMESFFGSAFLPPEFAALLKNPFKDKIVLVGATIEELKDNFSSPFYNYRGMKEKTPGVEYHANAIWTILNEKYIKTPDDIYAGMVMLLLVLITAITVHFLKPVRGLAVLVVELAGLSLISIYLFNHFGLWVKLTTPSLAAIFTFVGTGGYQFISEQKEKRMIKGMFQHYLAKDLVDELIANPDKLKLGGDKKELTVFFSDIEGFTSISEGLPPERLLNCLNEYLSAMTDIILENDGLLDKYIGDAIVAVWGAPIMREDHAILACRAALIMQKRLTELRQEWERDGKPEFKSRMGVNTGFMTIGNVGSHQRLSYTVIGDTVNLASRLEAINKQYQSYIIISQSTYEEAKEQFQVRELDLITVKGKTEPVRIYQLLEEAGVPLPQEQLQLIQFFSEGLKFYREQAWEKSISCFEQALKIQPHDYPSKLYLERGYHFLKNPPPSDWNGVWVYETK